MNEADLIREHCRMMFESEKLRAQNAKLGAMLRKVSRCCPSFGPESIFVCPICYNDADKIHEPDCELAALLEEVGGE